MNKNTNKHKDSFPLWVSYSQSLAMDVHNCVGFILLNSNICWWSQEGANSDMHQIQDLVNNSEDILFWFKMFLYFLIYICTDFYNIKFNTSLYVQVKCSGWIFLMRVTLVACFLQYLINRVFSSTSCNAVNLKSFLWKITVPWIFNG